MSRMLVVPSLLLLSISACQRPASAPIRKTIVLTPEQKAERAPLLDSLQREPSSRWVENNLLQHRRLLEFPDVIEEMKDGRRAYVFEVPATGESPPGTIDHLAIITDGGQDSPNALAECPLDNETILEVLYPIPATH